MTPALVCSPVDVAVQVLLELLDRSEAQCGVRASKAVLCVPAQFSEAARAATIEAAERTGLEKVRILEEPVAAALAYGVGCGDVAQGAEAVPPLTWPVVRGAQGGGGLVHVLALARTLGLGLGLGLG